MGKIIIAITMAKLNRFKNRNIRKNHGNPPLVDPLRDFRRRGRSVGPLAEKIKADMMLYPDDKDLLEDKVRSIGTSLKKEDFYHAMGTIVQGITKAKLKPSNIPLVINHICLPLHEKYNNFSEELLKAWKDVVLTKKIQEVISPFTHLIKMYRTYVPFSCFN